MRRQFRWSALLPVLLLLSGCGAQPIAQNIESGVQADASVQTEAVQTAETAAQTQTEEISYEPITDSDPNDIDYRLHYEEDVPEAAANAVAEYFFAVHTQNYPLYAKRLDPAFSAALEQNMQNGGSHYEEQSSLFHMEYMHQQLLGAAGAEFFNITDLTLRDVTAEHNPPDPQTLYGGFFVMENLDEILHAADSFCVLSVDLSGTDESGGALTIYQNELVILTLVGGEYYLIG